MIARSIRDSALAEYCDLGQNYEKDRTQIKSDYLYISGISVKTYDYFTEAPLILQGRSERTVAR
jgi:hypothetical protein